MALNKTYDDFLAKVHQVENELDRSEFSENTFIDKFNIVTSDLQYGFAFFKIVIGSNNQACDFIFIKSNSAFDKLTNKNFSALSGKKVSEIYDIQSIKFDWISVMGHVAIFGAKSLFQYFSEINKIWISVSAYCPYEHYFVVAIDDITASKQVEIEFNRQKNLNNPEEEK